LQLPARRSGSAAIPALGARAKLRSGLLCTLRSARLDRYRRTTSDSIARRYSAHVPREGLITESRYSQLYVRLKIISKAQAEIGGHQVAESVNRRGVEVDEVQSTLELGYMLASASQAWPNGRRFKLTPRCCRAALLRDVHFARDPKSGFPDTAL